MITQKFKVTILDIPGDSAKEHMQQWPSVQRIEKLPDECEPNEEFNKLWMWICREKKPVFVRRSGEMQKVGIKLRTSRGRPVIQVKVGQNYASFELMDHESELERRKNEKSNTGSIQHRP